MNLTTLARPFLSGPAPRRPILPAGVAAALLGFAANLPAPGQERTTPLPPVPDPTAPAQSPASTQTPPTSGSPGIPAPGEPLPTTGQPPVSPVDPSLGGLPPADPLAAVPSWDRPAMPATTYLQQQLPYLPWLSDDASREAERMDRDYVRSPFVQPGLGTPAIGDPMLPSAPPPARTAGVSPPIQAGPFDLRPRLSYRSTYGTGLRSADDEEGTWQHTITPGLIIYAGDHWTVGYSPSIRIYDREDYDNTVNHLVTLGGWAGWRTWMFRVSHATAISDDPLVETGEQTAQTSHNTGLSATWDRGAHGAYNFSLSQSLRSTDAYTDVASWRSDNSYDYPVSPRLRLGVGVGAGYQMVDPGTDMVNERLTVRASGPLGEKINYTLSTGAAFQQYIDTDASTTVSPLVGFNMSYRMLEKTSLSLGVSHDINSSYYSDQFTENTSFQGGISQELTPRWGISANGGYRFSSYQTTFGDHQEERADGTAFAGVSVSGQILPRTRLSVSYSYRTNDSDRNGFSSDSHQVGVGLSWSL